MRLLTMRSVARWGVPLGLVSLAAATYDCGSNPCACPSAGGRAEATIELACASPDAAVTTTGPCSAVPYRQQTVLVTNEDAGVCHVTVTSAGGAVSSTDITFTAQWLSCGADPHGCGEGFTASPSIVTIGSPCADSGADGEARD